MKFPDSYTAPPMPQEPCSDCGCLGVHFCTGKKAPGNSLTPPLVPPQLTTEQKREAIRAKCIELNPEILELKPGCMVQYGDYKDRQRVVAVTGDDGVWSSMQVSFHRFKDCPAEIITLFPQDEIEVIGRPVRLADVLLTCFSGPVNFKAFTSLGHESFIIALCNGGTWNLRRDSLDDQSDETIDFLYSLLS